jgi:hypothetical protein
VVTPQTIFWFTVLGKVSLEQPSVSVSAVAFRLEEIQEGKKIRIVTGHRCFDQYETGVQLLLDEAGRIVVERFDDLFDPLSARERKLRVVASNPECLAKQFGDAYDASYYSRKGV